MRSLKKYGKNIRQASEYKASLIMLPHKYGYLLIHKNIQAPKQCLDVFIQKLSVISSVALNISFRKSFGTELMLSDKTASGCLPGL